MKRDLLRKIKFIYNKEELKNLESSDKQENNSFNGGLVMVQEKDIVEIDIKECSFKEFLDKGKEIDKFNICMRNFIYEGSLSPDTIFKEQKIYILQNDNKKYFITLSKSQLIISEYNKTEKNIFETQLEVDYVKNKFQISKYIHDLNYSTGEHKSYPCYSELLKEYFTLDKKEAFSLARTLLNNLSEIKDIQNIIDYYDVYKVLNLMPDDYYTPVISDETISLSWIYSNNDKDLNQQKYVLFDIVLNDTKEVVGDISFDYNNTGFSYSGNVSYQIKEEFRNKHYASKALSLLKQLLKQHEFEGDKDLYISTVPENVKSQKVIENNEGNLIYEGLVPEEESIYYIDGVKEVKVYRIDMNKKS